MWSRAPRVVRVGEGKKDGGNGGKTEAPAERLDGLRTAHKQHDTTREGCASFFCRHDGEKKNTVDKTPASLGKHRHPQQEN